MSRKPASGLRFQPTGGRTQAKGPVVGQKQSLAIERLAHDGRGIAFADGRSWFVSGALPGEQVRARVLAARSKVVDAVAERIEQPATERIEPFCALSGTCGGCTLQHMPLTQQRSVKQDYLAEQLQRAGVEVAHWDTPLTGPDQGYRRRTRLAVRMDKSGQLQLGFRALASQDIINVAHCPVLVPELQPLLPALHELTSRLQQGRHIGHLELFSGVTTALLLRLTRPINADEQQRWRDFAAAQHIQLWWQEEGEPVPDQPDSRLGYMLEPENLFIDCRPGDFVQVNAEVNRQMVARALDWLDVQPHERVLDLFCGLGNFSLPLAQRAAEVIAVEGVVAMSERGQANAAQQGLNRLHFYAADLSEPLHHNRWAKQAFDKILLDPPRDGAQQAVSQLGKLNAGKLVYVSCNPATLARDAACLQQQGYRLQRACILDMFSHTGHVEAMALFESTAR